jgi:hypothetical protein
MPRLALSVLLIAALGLVGCAGTIKGDCSDLAGPGWTKLGAPPADGPELLKRLNLPSDDQVVWFAQGESKVFICDHGFGLVNPACGGSTGYQYDKVDGKWVSRGISLPVCQRADN